MHIQRLKLLFWKNLRLRKHHWFLTSVELLLPPLIAYLLAQLCATASIFDADPSKRVERNITVFQPDTKGNFERICRYEKVYYTPINQAIEDLLNSTAANCKLQSIIGLGSEKELESVIINASSYYSYYYRSDKTIGIVFHDILSNDSLPDELKYTMRDKEDWDTDRLYPQFDRAGPIRTDPYYNEGFSSFQLILNENFIKIKTNSSDLPKSEVQFELFPYPEYIQSNIRRSGFALSAGAAVFFVVFVLSFPLISGIIEEKISGVKELMKISGVNEWMMWFNWFIYAIMFNLISFTVMTIILTFGTGTEGSAVIHFTSFSLFWIFVMLYTIANVSFCLMISSIFHRTAIASAMYLFAIIAIVVGVTVILNKTELNLNVVSRLICAFPAGAFWLGFEKIKNAEGDGTPLTWISMTSSQANEISLFFAMMTLLLDTFVYFFLAYYITEVNPGKFGVAKSPLFVFQFLFSRFFDDYEKLEMSDKNNYGEFIEEPPANVETSIEINNVHKHFGSVYAVRGVNLSIYEGEMTALLGHNGAGKTTTMSIMTGLTSPSAGTMYYRKTNIFKNMDYFRQNMGLCSQEDRMLSYLSVIDHLTFFGQLKGISKKEADVEATEYLTMMEMLPKRNSLPGDLSGGMKRKLSLSIALMGKSDVLILDEPTSGMDVESRRKLWDLLLKMRGKRTIIFTTHYMEEADALGDRIAIMNHGTIVCYGTPIFLKKKYGTGYELTITKSVDSSASIKQVIESSLPEATQEFDTPKEIAYKLPLTETHKFPKLFENLESQKAKLGITNIGVAATTMEQVFLKVGGASERIFTSGKNTATDSFDSPDYVVNLVGLCLILQQILAIFKKKFMYTRRNLFSLIIRFIIPTIISWLLLATVKPYKIPEKPTLSLSPQVYPNPKVVLQQNGDFQNLNDFISKYVAEKGASIIKASNSEVEQTLIEYGRKDIWTYNHDFISAFEMNSSTLKIMNNPKLIHSLPITVNIYSNALLRKLSKNQRYSIETINHPVEEPDRRRIFYSNMCPAPSGYPVVDVNFYIWWIIALAFFTVDVVSFFSAFVNMERIDGFFHIQMMSNVSPFTYWFATAAFDFIQFSIFMAIRIALYKSVDYYGFLSFDSSSLGVFLLLLVLYGVSGLIFVYCTGYLFSSKGSSYTLFLILNLICTAVVAAIYGIDFVLKEAERAAERQGGQSQINLGIIFTILLSVAKALILVVPSLNFTSSFLKMTIIFGKNISQCFHCTEAEKAKCEAETTKTKYFEFSSAENNEGMLLELIFLYVDVALYVFILTAINTVYVRRFWNMLRNRNQNSEVAITGGDDDVQNEFNKVRERTAVVSVSNSRHQLGADHVECRTIAPRNDGVALLVNGLRKDYVKIVRKFTAVSNVSFSVQSGECFGLLGVNGAGKSTTFKMLTGEIIPTRGDSSIEGVWLSKNRSRYLSTAGYCPQTNSFIEELTGREMLKLIAEMRGVRSNRRDGLVNKWVTIIGLNEYQNKRCGSYSGGNKRKLCTVMSLIGDPHVVFLDEPTSGVDPVSRRNLYDIMAQSKKSGQTVILTSHSLEECETLCDRLTIMVNGMMKCIGTTQHLIKRYAQGFSLMVKLRDTPEFADKLHVLKAQILDNFTPQYCFLKDEHKSLLYYQITNTSLPWSILFGRMSVIKANNSDILEDYVLTDTTLEEVFISFAKGR